MTWFLAMCWLTQWNNHSYKRRLGEREKEFYEQWQAKIIAITCSTLTIPGTVVSFPQIWNHLFFIMTPVSIIILFHSKANPDIDSFSNLFQVKVTEPGFEPIQVDSRTQVLTPLHYTAKKIDTPYFNSHKIFVFAFYYF